MDAKLFETEAQQRKRIVFSRLSEDASRRQQIGGDLLAHNVKEIKRQIIEKLQREHIEKERRKTQKMVEKLSRKLSEQNSQHQQSNKMSPRQSASPPSVVAHIVNPNEYSDSLMGYQISNTISTVNRRNHSR